MRIQVDDEQDIFKIDKKIRNLLKKALEFALKEENLETEVELNVYFVDDSKIHGVNKEQRNIDKATDVLSFPMAEIEDGNFLEFDRNPETGLIMLGEIIVSTQTAIRQAGEYGHSVLREIMFLCTHGIYHILGYDHMNEDDEKEMISRQEKLLNYLGIARVRG